MEVAWIAASRKGQQRLAEAIEVSRATSRMRWQTTDPGAAIGAGSLGDKPGARLIGKPSPAFVYGTD